MESIVYESPQIEKVCVSLEQSIAGSVPVTPVEGNKSFEENWKEETIITGDIEIL